MACYCVFFSPTGTTEKVIKHIGQHFPDAQNIDIAIPDVTNYVMNAEDFCIVGVPSFGGRVPETAAIRLQKIQGNGTPALLLVTYGGRAYEDTLKELKDILEKQNFVCVGAAAMVAEHSIVHQIETGRPDLEDYKELDAFIIEIKKRLAAERRPIEVPGNTPYKEYKILPIEIEVLETCVKCGLCAKKCPVNAIDPENFQLTDNKKCIGCMRCVNLCPHKARRGNPAQVELLLEKLQKMCIRGKKNEFF